MKCRIKVCENNVYNGYAYCSVHITCGKTKCQLPVDFLQGHVYCAQHLLACKKNSSCKEMRARNSAYCAKHHKLLCDLRARKREEMKMNCMFIVVDIEVEVFSE
jgi:hypothetical protein